MIDPIKSLELILQINYISIPKSLRKRYATLLAARAVRFYIENQLDSLVVDEDLADGKTDTGWYEGSLSRASQTDLCNVIYGEKEEIKYQKELRATLASIKK